MVDASPTLFYRIRRSRWSLALLVVLTAFAAALPLLLPAGVTPVASAQGAPQAAAGGSMMLFQANLSGAAEAPVPVTDTAASGWALMALNQTDNTLYYRVMVNDIVSVTAAHIHTGTVGVAGPVAHGLYMGGAPFDEQNPVSGTVTLSDGQVDLLMNGGFYVNVHNVAHPGGEIRGQLEAWTPPTGFHSGLLGSNEVPARNTEAEGLARYTLVGTDTLQYEITVRDIMSITGAHIHRGWPGMNGPVIYGLYDGGAPFGPGQPISGTITGLTGQDMVDLLTGYYYTNVHTQTFPGGEIRGQIGGAHAFEADLSGANEAPPAGPVNTPARGHAVLVLSADASTLHYRVSVRDIMSITMGHLHLAPPGVNGPVIHGLYDGSVPFGPGQPISGTLPFTPTSVLDMIAGDYYVNIHTQANPAGEIRGQVAPLQPGTNFRVQLSNVQEVPPTKTGASGVAELTLDSDINRLFYQVEVSNIVSITMAHLHEAPFGVNGPVRHFFFPHDATRPGTIDNDAFSPDQPVGGGIYLDADSLLDLLSNFYYVNVHTTAFPGGEIRGQVVADPDKPTAVTVETLGTTPSSGVLPFGLAALALTALAGAGVLALRRRR